jgi:uncharacterized protein
MQQPYWKIKQLQDMSRDEWEALCDGCGKCCLHKLEDDATGEVFYTRVACRLLDLNTCRCTRYAERLRWVPDCLEMTAEIARTAAWLPPTCAYRLIALGQDLPPWHPLISGNPATIHQVGASIHGKAVSEIVVGEDDYEDHIIDPARL